MKPYELVSVSNGGGRLHVQLKAIARFGHSHELFEEIRQMAVAANATELLIDTSAFKGKLSVMQRLQMILAFVANLRGYRVAGVISKETIDPQRLGETMARNRGANVRVFTCMAEAIQWLDGARPSTPGWPNSADTGAAQT